MGEVVLILGWLILAAGSLFVGYQGWKAVIKNPRLRGRPREDLRALTRSTVGVVILVVMIVAGIGGLVGGVLLGERVQEGKERYLKERR